ncbi:YjbD family protein, partial [Enterobacter bugandensis]
MYLSAVLIRNFRGIRNLEINFEQDNTVLIGENSWGKSSLLRALWLALGQGE